MENITAPLIPPHVLDFTNQELVLDGSEHLSWEGDRAEREMPSALSCISLFSLAAALPGLISRVKLEKQNQLGLRVSFTLCCKRALHA